jgi:hypothetical protein
MDQDLEEMDLWGVDLVPAVETVPITKPVAELGDVVGLVVAGLAEDGQVEEDFFKPIQLKMKLPTWNKKKLSWKNDWKN